MAISAKHAGLTLLTLILLAWLGVNTYLSLAALSETRNSETRDSGLTERRIAFGSGLTIVAPTLLESGGLEVRLRRVEQSGLDAFGEIAQPQIDDLTNIRDNGGWVRIRADLSQASLEIWDWPGDDFFGPLEVPLNFSSSDFRDYIQPVAEAIQEEITANFEDARIEFHRLRVDNGNRAGEFYRFETQFTHTERLETLDEAYVDDIPEWRVIGYAVANRQPY